MDIYNWRYLFANSVFFVFLSYHYSFLFSGDRHFDLERCGLYERNELGKPRKIPSLIDTMLEGRRFEFSRSTFSPFIFFQKFIAYFVSQINHER